MNTEDRPKKKRWWSLDPTADEQEENHPRARRLKHEVKHLRRVPKRGEKARKHMSEALEQDRLTEKDFEITREVLGGLTDSPAPAPPFTAIPEVPSFPCFECGAVIPKDSIRCPKCEVLYIRDPKGEAEDASIVHMDKESLEWEHADIFKEGATAFAHFDFSSGIVNCLEADEDADFGYECLHCGAVTQFGIPRCPLCGHSFDEDDTGLVGLLEGIKFDLDEDKELNCPSCGEHIVVDGGICPSCKEVIIYRSANSPDAGVLTILKQKDVVFVHLDVRNGDLWFARKMRLQKTGDIQSVHLDSISKGGFNHDWKSLVRI